MVRRPAPQGLCRAGPARPDPAAILGLQPGLCPGPERAFVDDGLDGHHPGRYGAASGGGEGAQAGCGNLREIPDQFELRRIDLGARGRARGMIRTLATKARKGSAPAVQSRYRERPESALSGSSYSRSAASGLAPEETYGQTRFLSGLALQTCRPGEIH